MRDANNHVIYIGKAKNLPNRLNSYFKSGSHDAKTTAMLGSVADFDYLVCSTEKDALGLEANLIKKHKPHYNILLKDNKSFPYIRIVRADFPYLEVTRNPFYNSPFNERGGVPQARRGMFGPYFNGIWARELLDVIQDVFGVRQCTHMAKVPCINHQMDKCPAPCAGKISHTDYAAIIDNIKSFLRGERDHGARQILTQKMERAAGLNQFELAIRYRDSLKFLDKLKERTITMVGRDVNCDAFAYAARADVFVVSVLTVRAGKLIGVQNFANQNNSPLPDDEKLQEFIAQYYLENIQPDEIVTDAVKGYKRKLLDMAAENAHEYIETSIEKIAFKTQFTLGACAELAAIIMGAEGVARRRRDGVVSVGGTAPAVTGWLKKIECFDISHFGGGGVVASMVVFIDGVPEKKLYRKFRIRHGEGNNDVLSMHEVLTRRLNRLGTHDDSFGPAPDLIFVDGGRGQLSAVRELFAGTNISVAAFSENNELFLPNKPEPIILDKRSYALRLVQRIRDEAHRFAIGYQKKLR